MPNSHSRAHVARAVSLHVARARRVCDPSVLEAVQVEPEILGNHALRDRRDDHSLPRRLQRGPGQRRLALRHKERPSTDGLQLIPVSEVAARDEFTGIKGVTRDDVLASLRTPPQLLGIVPQNAGGFGSIREAASVWASNELAPIQWRLARVNAWIGYDVITFDPFDPAQLGP